MTEVGPAKWSLHCFYESAARNGLDYIATISDQLLPRNSGDNMVFNTNGVIRQVLCRTAGVANVDEWQIGKPADSLLRSFGKIGVLDQTDVVRFEDIVEVRIPVSANEVLNSRCDNANTAQIDAVGVFVDYGANGCIRRRPTEIGKETLAVKATGSTTLTANTWTTATLTYPNLDPRKVYRIIGLAVESATGYFARLVFQNTAYRPGVPIVDLGDSGVIFWGDYGSFLGQNEPNIEILASGADSSETVTMILVEE